MSRLRDRQGERNVLLELAWMRSSSSGKIKPLTQSSASHSSLGSESDAASQVDISGVKPSVPYCTVVCVSVSPLVV